MARNTPAEVAAIVPRIAEASLPPFIATANLVVEESLVGKGLTEARLKLIELYLSGHYALVSHGGDLMSEKVGDASETYAKGPAGHGFLATELGRQALSLDTTGTLTNLNQPSASLSLLT